MKEPAEWRVCAAFSVGNSGSCFILKCANLTHALRIYSFVCTVKFTDHEYQKPLVHPKALEELKCHRDG